MRIVTFKELEKIVEQYIKEYYYYSGEQQSAGKLYKLENGKRVEVDCSIEPGKTIIEYFKKYYFIQQYAQNVINSGERVIKIPDEPKKKINLNDADFIKWIILMYDRIENEQMYKDRINTENAMVRAIHSPSKFIRRKLTFLEAVRMLKVADSLTLPKDSNQDFLKEFKIYLEDNKLIQKLREKSDFFNKYDETDTVYKSELDIDKENAERYIMKMVLLGKNDFMQELEEKIENENVSLPKDDENIGNKISIIRMLMRRNGINTKVCEDGEFITIEPDTIYTQGEKKEKNSQYFCDQHITKMPEDFADFDV